MRGAKRILFYSRYVFYEPLHAVFSELCDRFRLDGHIITHEKPEAPKVYAPEGFLTPQSAGLENVPDFVTILPANILVREKVALLKKEIDRIHPDYIWAHEEPTDSFVNEMLRWFYFRQTPRIVVSVVENIWRSGYSFRERYARLRRKWLWKRYDGVLGATTKSIDAIWSFGMPRSVPTRVAWLPHVPPPTASNSEDGCFLPKKTEGAIFIGFAGRIIAAKGWRVLLAALTLLPEAFKCLIAGTGDEESELRLWCLVPPLRSRVHYLGLLEKAKLWDFYRALDIFVLPSLTSSTWMEQFGSVLAEAMSCGVPVIGSSSGAIPEVVGDCGIVVEENNPGALAKAICTLAGDTQLRTAYSQRGLLRFQREFSHTAYAEKLAAALGLTGDV